MVDYKLIADSDPGGDLQAAFDTMAAETVSKTPEVYVNYTNLMAVDLALAGQLSAIIKAAVDAGTLPEVVHIRLNNGGLNINNPSSGYVLQGFVEAGYLTQAEKDTIMAMGVVTTKKYPGLKPGHVQNARQKRAEGIV
jgi:hypothetical protein